MCFQSRSDVELPKVRESFRPSDFTEISQQCQFLSNATVRPHQHVDAV